MRRRRRRKTILSISKKLSQLETTIKILDFLCYRLELGVTIKMSEQQRGETLCGILAFICLLSYIVAFEILLFKIRLEEKSPPSTEILPSMHCDLFANDTKSCE